MKTKTTRNITKHYFHSKVNKIQTVIIGEVLITDCQILDSRKSNEVFLQQFITKIAIHAYAISAWHSIKRLNVGTENALTKT